MYDHLWNDMPFEERHRLMPHAIESKIHHIKATRQMLVEGHRRTLREIDSWIKNLEESLEEAAKESN